MNLAADLPAPRDDEPADLRRDIVDELTDHLHCAIDRERQRAALNEEDATTNEDHLWPRVVARFGHPARIARQLWWDAMKEKIMSQRTQTASLVVMGLFCLVMLTVTLVTLFDNRRLNEAVMTQLKELANRPAPAVPAHETPAVESPSEWNQLTIKCRWGTNDGEPAEGVIVYLESNSENTVGIPAGEEVTNAEGVVDFGKVLYGTYLITVTTPAGLTTREYVAVRPGQDTSVMIACPEEDGVRSVSLAADLDWSTVPESIRDRIWLHCMIYLDDEVNGYGSDWWDTNYDYEWPAQLTAYGSAFEDGASRSTGLNDAYLVASYFINEAGQIVPTGPGTDLDDANATQLGRVAANSTITVFDLPENPEYLTSIELPPGGYQVQTRFVVADPADEAGRRLLAIGGLPGEDSGAPQGFYGGQGGSDRDWGSRRRMREEMNSQEFQLGALPFTFLGLDEQRMIWGHYGTAATVNRTETLYLVHWRDETRWDIPVYPYSHFPLQLGDLALRVPLGMEIGVIAARITLADATPVDEAAVIDLVWRGLVIQEDGAAVAEEHVLLRGVDVITKRNEADYGDGTLIRELYVPTTPEELSYVNDAAIVRGLWARPSTDPHRTSADPPIDDTLLHRLRADSVPYPGTYPIDLPAGMHVVTVAYHLSNTAEMQPGATCDINTGRPREPRARGGAEDRKILVNRLVCSLSEAPSEDSGQTELQVLVTPEEAAVIELARQVGTVHADPVNGPADCAPFEQTPRLEELRQDLEEQIRLTVAPPGMEVGEIWAYIAAEHVDDLQSNTAVDLVWSGLMLNADGQLDSEEHILISGLDLVSVGRQIDHDDDEVVDYVQLHIHITPQEASALETPGLLRRLYVRPSSSPVRASAGEPIAAALLERFERDAAQYVSRDFFEDERTEHTLAYQFRPMKVGAPATGFDGRTVDDLAVGMLCNLYLVKPPAPDAAGVPQPGQPLLLLANRMAMEEVATNEAGVRETVIFIHEDEVDLIEAAQRVGEVVALPVYGVPADIESDDRNPDLFEKRRILDEPLLTE